MTWLTALIALIAIVFFAIAYPGFRKFLLVLFVGLVGAGVAIYLYFQNDLRQREKRELQARSLIRSSEVEFQNLIMSDSYGSWKVKGLVKNNSRYQIEKIKLTVEVSNCDGHKGNCVVVGTDDDVTSYLDIPPGQARALESFVTLRNLPQLTDWSWSYRVGYVQAKQ
jgi:uncharacterized membrane protein